MGENPSPTCLYSRGGDTEAQKMLPKLSLPTVAVPTELQSSMKRVLDGIYPTYLNVTPTVRSCSSPDGRPPQEETGRRRSRSVQVPRLSQDGLSCPGKQEEERTTQNGPWYITLISLSPLLLSLCSFYIASFLCARLRHSQNLEREANLFDQGNGRISSEVFVIICKKGRHSW